jgi:PAB-dependent poly(A)-specific ribonuclease subunit 2
LEVPTSRARPRAPDEPPGELLCVPAAPFAFGDGLQPLSDCSVVRTVRVGAPPHALDGAVTRDMKTLDWVGYLPNPAFKRGAPRGDAARGVAALRSARVTRRREAGMGGMGMGMGTSSMERGAPGRRRTLGALPAAYRYTEARAAAGAGGGARAAFEYDFGAYNATRLAGLENDLANGYVNPVLQLLYYTPHLRAALLRHVCEREFCLACELGFLAHSLRVCPPGGTCRAANLLRTLRQIREAGALGLLEGPEELGGRPDACLPRRVQALCRFVLEQLAKEEASHAASSSERGGGGGGGRAPPRPPAAERVFGGAVLQRTTCAHCSSVTSRDVRSLAFDLSYPTPPAAAAPGATAGGGAPGVQATAQQAAQQAPGGAASARPRFAGVLAASLCQTAEVRAWCEGERAYHRAHTERVLRSLPQSLLLCCGMKDAADLHWWGVSDAAIKAAADADKRAAAAAAGGVPGVAAAAASAASAASSSFGLGLGGDASAGYDPAETAPVAERWLPHAVRITLTPSGGVRVEQADSAAALPGASNATSAVYELGAMVARIRPRSGEAEATGASAAEAQQAQEGHLVAHVRVLPPYVEQRGVFVPAPGAAHAATPGVSPLVHGAAAAARAAAAAAAAASAPPVEPSRAMTPPPPPSEGEDGSSSATAPATPSTPARRGGGGDAGAVASDWVLLNDFAVTPTSTDEVSTLYGCAKQPCVLLFVRADAPPPPPLPPPVMTEAAYARLTRARPPAPGATFRPLDMVSERPRAGMLLGIDAEFVALSPADKSVRPDGSEVVLRPPRLGLARVSVVRGSGPSAGVPLQDDYVRAVEPVHDYLTRYSGLTHGDLDPQLARHCNGVTSLKAAYLKLRYLVDAGCRFCGHGLSSDFRCINMLVPPEQVVDTVELFHFKRQRKLSLRFLARSLLGVDIQRGSHDSIEDARTALALYAKYTELQAAGTLQETLLALYRHGKQHGWDGAASAPPLVLEARPPAAGATATATALLR